jgi:hypothetical protein
VTAVTIVLRAQETAGSGVCGQGQRAEGEVTGQVAELPGGAIGQELLGLTDQARLAGLVDGEAAALAAVLGHVQHGQQLGEVPDRAAERGAGVRQAAGS